MGDIIVAGGNIGEIGLIKVSLDAGATAGAAPGATAGRTSGATAGGTAGGRIGDIDRLESSPFEITVTIVRGSAGTASAEP
jgi:hypothetical protein